MFNKTFNGILMVSLIFVFFFNFSLPEISRISILNFNNPGPHFSPGPLEPLGPQFPPGPVLPPGPTPNAEFQHPHMMPGPNEPLGPNPEGITPPHCPPGPNEPLGPHNFFGGQTRAGGLFNIEFGERCGELEFEPEIVF